MAKRRALVIGGSVGGLFAAHLLRHAGWDAFVYERSTGDLGDRGTGIGTRPELFAVMRRIGLAADASLGVEVQGRVGLDRSGAVLHELAVRAVTSSWSRIWRPLRQALPDECFASGKVFVDIEQDERRVAAIFEDGSRAEGDLLIAADGTHSAVRARLMPAIEPASAGYIALRGVVDPDRLSPALQQLTFHNMVFGFPDGELMLSIPMSIPNRDGRTCHFVWFRPRRHSDEARPGRAVPALTSSELGSLAPELAAVVRATPQVFTQAIFDLESPRIAYGRVALIGDAAFVARPHVATGVLKAAIDAESLVDALAACGNDVAAGLDLYNSQRQPYGKALVARGRHIGALVMATGSERHETLMREYGSAGMVADQPIMARLP